MFRSVLVVADIIGAGGDGCSEVADLVCEGEGLIGFGEHLEMLSDTAMGRLHASDKAR